jgi:hypothetical protein
MGVLLDMGAQFSNLDPAYIMETVTRQITASLTQAPQLIADMTFYLNFDPAQIGSLNYYEAGSAAGRLIKVFFDFTVDN